ncbi:MAG: alpha/beta fold hydrolase [Dehalococcoidia bacterium]
MASERQPEDKYVEVGGLRLHYLDWGGRSDRVVLLVHGLTGNAHDWDEIAHALSDEYRVLSLDQRGHGDSQWAADGYWPHLFGADVYQLAFKLDIVPFDLIGHSLGVWTGIAYAGDHWRDLSHLMLSDFGPEVGRESARAIQSRTGNRPLGFRNAEEAMAWLQETYPTRPTGLLERRVKYGMRVNWAGRLVWKHDPDLFWLTGSAALREVPYLWEQLGKAHCPILVMRGERSPMLTLDIRDRMLATAPRAKGVEVKGAGHYLYDENPQEFSRLTREFLAT